MRIRRRPLRLRHRPQIQPRRNKSSAVSLADEVGIVEEGREAAATAEEVVGPVVAATVLAAQAMAAAASGSGVAGSAAVVGSAEEAARGLLCSCLQSRRQVRGCARPESREPRWLRSGSPRL
jgi:hypothetical protein